MRILFYLLLAMSTAFPVSAQHLFGSRDDPAEYNGLAWWETEAIVDVSAGFSLIGPQWRSFGRMTLNAKRSELGLKIDAGARAGVYGAYSDDFDDWRDAGNPGWGYDDVLPVFKAIEDNQTGADAFRGTGGPVHVTDTSPPSASLPNNSSSASGCLIFSWIRRPIGRAPYSLS